MQCIDYVIYHKAHKQDIECKILDTVYEIKRFRAMFEAATIRPMPMELLRDLIPADYRDNLIETGVFILLPAKRFPHFQNQDSDPLSNETAEKIIKEALNAASINTNILASAHSSAR